MAIKYSVQKFGSCFPTKILGGNGGAHILNMVVGDTDLPNGVVVGVGDYVSFDQYKVATAPSTYEGVITEQAANGNWYVQVKKVDVNNPAVLICEVEMIAEDYNADFTDVRNWYNPKATTASDGTVLRDETVRGYVLSVLDVYELSAELFTGTPAPGKKVTISGTKHVVGA